MWIAKVEKKNIISFECRTTTTRTTIISAMNNSFWSRKFRDYLKFIFIWLCPTRFYMNSGHLATHTHTLYLLYHSISMVFSFSLSLFRSHSFGTWTIIHSFGLPSLQSLNKVFISFVLHDDDDLVLWSNQLDYIYTAYVSTYIYEAHWINDAL